MRFARAWALALVGLLVLGALVPIGGPAARPAPLPALATAHVLPATGTPLPRTPDVLGGLLQHNLSWTSPDSSPSPLSAIPDSPPPALPSTTPTVVYVANATRTCCGYVNVTPPGGPWDAVILNYTGSAVGGVYDSSYRAYIGGAQVFFGTTPEYGTWTVLANLTQYESLLEPGANFTFILSAALLGGYFETTLRLSFYPVPSGAVPPSEPSRVVPLWEHYITPSVPTLTVNASVPDDASAAVLQLWTYGFQDDEFWWSQSAPGTPDRALSVEVNGSEFAAVFPFPYINTGGVDLFLWRPIPAAFTLNDRPYDVNVTGALGQLEGTHSFTASIANRNSTSDWLVGGSLLLWTNPNVTSAVPTAGNASLSTVMRSGSTSSMTTAFTWSSILSTSTGPVTATSTGSGTFSETLTTASVGAGLNGSQWTNVSQTSSLVDDTIATDVAGSTWSNSNEAFQIGPDLATQFREASSTGGGYPVTENVTTSMLDLEQKWTGAASTVSRVGATFPTPLRTTVDNEVTGGNGIWLGVETIATATSAPTLISITPVQSATPKYTAESTSGPDGTSAYSHVSSGSSFSITDPNDAETVLEDRYDTFAGPLIAVVSVEPDPVDAGTHVTIAANAQGGAGVYHYSWFGLPTGCVATDSPSFSCNATTAGTFRATVAVSDTVGDLEVSSPSAVVVNPSLQASITSLKPAADVGGPLSLLASVAGGAPPYSCAWSISGGAPIDQGCQAPLAVPTTVAGPVSAALLVTDGTGANVSASPIQVAVNNALIVTVVVAEPNATVRVGSPTYFLATVLGGTTPDLVTWFEGNAPISGINGTNATIVPSATGPLSVHAEVTDAAGGMANSSAVSVQVAPAPGAQNTSAGGSGSSGVDVADWIAIGLAAVAAVEAVLLVGLRRPPRAPGA
jgi:hypothetical protein